MDTEYLMKDIDNAAHALQGLILYGITKGLFRSVDKLTREQDRMFSACYVLIDWEHSFKEV